MTYYLPKKDYCVIFLSERDLISIRLLDKDGAEASLAGMCLYDNALSEENAITAVKLLKKVLSVKDTGTLIAAGQARQEDPQRLYGYFCRALDQALADTAASLDEHAEREDLAQMALELALRSYANQLACARILDILHPPGEEKEKKSKSKK